MLKWSLRDIVRFIFYTLFLVELVYLIAANWFINSGLLQQKINHQPARMMLNWEAAFTPFPGLIWVNELTLKSQTARIQSLLELDQAYGQINLGALLNRTLSTRWMRSSGIRAYVRPRPRQGRPFRSRYLYFPPIPGVKTGMADNIIDPQKYSYGTAKWHIRLNHAHFQQFDDVWIWDHRFKATGLVSGDFSLDVGDHFWADKVNTKMVLHNIKINDRIIANEVNAKSNFKIEPFRPRDHPGWASTPFVSGNLTLGGKIHTLEFLDHHPLNQIEGITLGGSGLLNLRLSLERGQVLPDSSFTIRQTNLDARIKEFHFNGQGMLAGGLTRLHEKAEWQSDIGIYFNQVGIRHQSASKYAVISSDLLIKINGDRPVLGQKISKPKFAIELKHGVVPDLATLNAYIPESMNFVIKQGHAKISASMNFDQQGVSLHTNLTGEIIHSTLGKHPFSSQFESTLVLNRHGDSPNPYDLSGSEFILRNAAKLGTNSSSERWMIQIRVDTGNLLPEVAREYKRLRLASGEFNLTGTVSDIGLLNPLLTEVKGLELGGEAKLMAHITVMANQQISDSELTLLSDEMSVNFLDQRAFGLGYLIAKLKTNAMGRRVKLEGIFPNISIAANGADNAHVKKVEFQFFAEGGIKSFSEKMQGLQVQLDINNAQIPDLTVYNRYLPLDTGIWFKSGRGQLDAKFSLSLDKIQGNIQLNAHALEMMLRDQQIFGNLNMAVTLQSNDVESRAFDINGSWLKLVGYQAQAKQKKPKKWIGQAYVEQGRIRWKSPLAVNARVKLFLDDSAPLVYLFAPERVRNSLVKNVLSVKDVIGTAHIGMDDQAVILNDVKIMSDKLSLLSHLRFRNNTLDGIVYSQYGALGASVKIEHGERNWKWIGAHKWYDSYLPFKIPNIN